MSKIKNFTCSDCGDRKPLPELEYANIVENTEGKLEYIELCNECYSEENTLLITVTIIDDELPF